MSLLASFRTALNLAATATLVAAVSLGAGAAMVINEIHYDPQDKTHRTEFIELLNASEAEVDLSNWKLANAVEFTFPAGTLVPAQRLVVVAGGPADFQTAFGFAPLGPWTGRLKHGGAHIELHDAGGVLRDEVEYGAGFPWPTGAHGDGASMELISASLDNNLGGSWRSSGSTGAVAKATTYIGPRDLQWRFRKGTNEASMPTNAWRQVDFIEDDTWQTAQTSIGFGDNDDNTDLSKPPWGLPVPMQTNYISLYLRHPFTIPEGSLPTRLHLRVQIEDGCVVWVNGQEVAPRLHMRDKLEKPFDAGTTGRPPGATLHKGISGGKPVWEDLFIPARNAGLRAGTNVVAIHAFNSTLTGAGMSIDCQVIGEAADPTPGAPNTSLALNAPPQVRQVNHSPQQPRTGAPVVITAKVTDPDGVTAVSLAYQVVDPGTYIRKSDPDYASLWTMAAMSDDGRNGDAAAGDGVFSATLPPELQTHRRLIRYRILATDSAGNSVQVPYADDPQPNFAYFTYDGVPPWSGAVLPGDPGPQGRLHTFTTDVTASLPVYHLIASETDVVNSQYNNAYDTVPMWGTLVYGDQVLDHITFNNRGEFSTYVSGKNKWRIHLNNTHEILVRDNYGRPFSQTRRILNLNGGACPWAPLNRGMAGIEECISYRMYELLGAPASHTHYISFRVIDNVVEAADPLAMVEDATFPGLAQGQYSGDLWGLYLVIEEPDGAFLDERDMPDGNTYKIQGGGSGTGNKKNQGPTQPATTADWDSFASLSASGQKEGWWRTNLNLQAYYGFRIASRIVGNVDMREGWNHYFYHHPDGHWAPIPWDLDMMFIGRTHWSASGAITQDGCVGVPALAIEKRNRAREVLDLLLSDLSPNGGQVGQLVDEYAQLVHPAGGASPGPTWTGLFGTIIPARGAIRRYTRISITRGTSTTRRSRPTGPWGVPTLAGSGLRITWGMRSSRIPCAT
jgi:hypothetical protein